MQHAVKHDTQGSGNMESITPYCECGWRGLPAYAYNDDQLTDVRRQGDRHLKNASTQSQATRDYLRDTQT